MFEAQEFDKYGRLLISEDLQAEVGCGIDFTDVFDAADDIMVGADVAVSGGTKLTHTIVGNLVVVWAKAWSCDQDMVITCTCIGTPQTVGGVEVTLRLPRSIVIKNRPH